MRTTVATVFTAKPELLWPVWRIERLPLPDGRGSLAQAAPDYSYSGFAIGGAPRAGCVSRDLRLDRVQASDELTLLKTSFTADAA